MNRIILITLITFVFLGCDAQVKKVDNNKKMDLSFIQNGKVKHSIVMLSCDTCAPITNTGFRVVVNLSKNEIVKVKKITTERWLQLLNDDKSDYLANLILYELYNKSAIRFLQIDNVKKWRKYMKKEDLKYWESHLQN